MKLAVYMPDRVPTSQEVYRTNLTAQFERMGHELIRFGDSADVPTRADLVWVPAALMRELFQVAYHTHTPIISSLHGPFSFSLPLQELESGSSKRASVLLKGLVVDYWWRTYGDLIAGVIASSHFGAEECARLTRLPREQIYPVYPGIDLDLFQAEGKQSKSDIPYFFHNAARQTPRKNSDRVLKAYSQMELDSFKLVAIVPGLDSKPQGVEVIKSRLSQAQLAQWYRGAIGFLYPSLHETFGVAIIEAMACGCPVVTSNQTACPEVAGDAALTVNPRSISEISEAMCRLAFDQSLREGLRKKGLKRARHFSWEASAQAHVKVFEKVLSRVQE